MSALQRVPAQNIPYLERLRQLNLERLDVRRLRADLILAYKILFGITGETDISQFFTICDNLHNTRGHQIVSHSSPGCR